MKDKDIFQQPSNPGPWIIYRKKFRNIKNVDIWKCGNLKEDILLLHQEE